MYKLPFHLMHKKYILYKGMHNCGSKCNKVAFKCVYNYIYVHKLVSNTKIVREDTHKKSFFFVSRTTKRGG